jgi:hypothetical protein
MTTNETTLKTTASLNAYLAELTGGQPTPRPDNESWQAMLERIASASGPCEIDEETYFWFLEVLPPRFMQGSCFCFAEGIEPFRLFWRRNGRHFVRSLDWQQTRILCRLAGIRAYD